MIKAIVVDDEELARERILGLIQENCPDIEVTESCSNGIEAIEAVNKHRPDLIFLDIQMPGKNGFEVLAELESPPPIVFTTAYDQYALRAFEENSIAYLLKPIESDQLKKAIAKFSKNQAPISSSFVEEMRKMMMPQKNPYLQRLQVKVGERILLLDLKDISYFESEDKYTSVYSEGHKYIIDTPLVELETKLNPEQFMRIHRSCIANIQLIGEIHKHIGGKLKIVLKNADKTTLVVSRSYTDKVRSL